MEWVRNYPLQPALHPVIKARFGVADESEDARIVAVGDRLAIVTEQSLGLRPRLVNRQGADVYTPRDLAPTTDTLYDFALASDGEQGVVVAWVTSVLVGGELKAQAFDASGQPRSQPVLIARGLHDAASPHVAAGGGKFVVGWSEQRPNSLELRVFSLAGKRLGAPRLPRATGPPQLRILTLTNLVAAPRGAMVVWNTLKGDLFAARFEWDWKGTTPSLSLPADPLGERLFGRIATNGNGDWAAAWKEISASSAPLATNEARTFSDR